MSQVSISDLKQRLSHYLREVKRGGEVQVLDRGKPVAVLTRLPATPEDPMEERRRRLVGAGVLRPGSGGTSSLLARPVIELPVSLVEALSEERRDRV